jgi:hypothetical protein
MWIAKVSTNDDARRGTWIIAVDGALRGVGRIPSVLRHQYQNIKEVCAILSLAKVNAKYLSIK